MSSKRPARETQLQLQASRGCEELAPAHGAGDLVVQAPDSSSSDYPPQARNCLLACSLCILELTTPHLWQQDMRSGLE